MHVEWVDDEAVVLDSDTGQLHHLNPPAALVYALILEHGYDEAVTTVKRMHPDDRGVTADLGPLIEDMQERGLLIDG